MLTANVATNQAGKIALVWRDFSGYQAPHVPLDRTHIAVLLPGSHTWKDTKLDPPTLSRCFLPSSCPIALTSDGTVLSAIDQTGGTRFVIVQHGKASVGPRTVLPASYQQTTVVGASNLFSALLYSLPVYSHGTKILPEGFAEASARVGLSSSIIAFKYHKVRGAVFARPVLIPFKNGSYGKAQALPLRSLVGQILDGVAVPDISGTNISDFSTAQVSSAGAHTVGVIPVARGEISMSDLTQAYLTDGSVDFSKLPSMSKIKKDVLGEYVTVFQMS